MSKNEEQPGLLSLLSSLAVPLLHPQVAALLLHPLVARGSISAPSSLLQK